MKTYENEEHFLRRDIDTIFLMMGNECNLNCRYCLQHPLVEHPISHDINPDIYKFIEQVCRENFTIPLNIRFWGGEPLVFLPNIKKIVNELEKRELPVNFSTMSNGKLVTTDLIEYMKLHKFNFAISWDGRNSIQTRGYDAMKDKKDILFRMPNLCLSAVLSSYAYPKQICEDFQQLDEEYFKIHQSHLRLNIDDIFNTGELPEDLLNINYDRVISEMIDLASIFIEDKYNNVNPPEHYAINNYIGKLYDSIKTYYVKNNGEWNNIWCCCGNGYNTLDMGIDGKLYPCHNTSHSIGTIYDGYFKYLRNLLKEDVTFEHRFDNTCKECPAICYCHGGCKLVSQENRDKTYCNLKKSIIVPVINLLSEFGKEL